MTLNSSLKNNRQKRMGVGELSIARKRVSHKRKKKRLQQSPRVRQIDAPGDGYEFIVYFRGREMRRVKTLEHSASIADYLRSSVMNKFKIGWHKHPWFPFDIVDYVKLEDENDLLMLMLCHKESIRKIFRLKNNEAPEGAL